MFQRFILLFTCALGCAMTFKASATEPQEFLRDSLPDHWQYVPDHVIEEPNVTDSWWREFHDSVLDSLVILGVSNNFDVAMAMRRSQIARNSMLEARSAWLPSIGLDLAWNKMQQSGANGSPVGPPTNVSYFSAGLSAQWEIDIFGKIAAGVKAKKASYMASRAEYAGTMVSIAAQIASTYIQLREYQQQLLVATIHSQNQMKIVNIARARFETTLASKLDVAQAMETYYSTTAMIPMLYNSIHITINSLAVLTALDPSEVERIVGKDGSFPAYDQLIGTGIPADLLRRRPDIAQAEMQLAADAQQVGIAKKDFLPTLSISGSIGTQAHNAGDLFTHNSFTYSVVPTLSWTIFDGFARKYSLNAARETMQASIENYNLTVINALRETDNALSTYRQSILYAEAMQKVIDQNREELDLAIDRYKNSLSPMSDVVNAQLRALADENSLISARGQALSALISLYEALGGGFDIRSLDGNASPL